MKNINKFIKASFAIIALPMGLYVTGCAGDGTFTNEEINTEISKAFGSQFEPYGELTIDFGEVISDHSPSRYQMAKIKQSSGISLFQHSEVKRLTDPDLIDSRMGVSDPMVPEYTVMKCKKGQCEVYFPDSAIYRITKPETLAILKEAIPKLVDKLGYRHSRVLELSEDRSKNKNSWGNS